MVTLDYTKTEFDKVCEILADFWMTYRNDENLEELFSYSDLAFPIAFAISNNMVKKTEKVDEFILETWDILLQSMNLEDIGYDSMEHLLGEAES